MDRFEAMTILLAAIDTGSLSAASRKLRIPLATVSRRVLDLEEHLSIRLLVRGNRKLTLTEAGRGYVASCRRILDEIAEVERTASGEYHTPQGEVVISMPPVMGRMHVLPIIVEFLGAFPQIRMQAQLTDRFVNLLEERVDLVIRVGEQPSSSLIGTPVGVLREVVCASPEYLSRRGVPKRPEDLPLHDCVGYAGYAIGNNWKFRSKGVLHTVQVPSRLAVNSVEGAVIAAVEGAGIAKVASYQIDDLVKSRTLVKLLDGFEPPPLPVNIMYVGQGQIPLKLRAFLDFAIPRLRKKLGYEQPSVTGEREPPGRRRSKAV
ncbi:LysR family transcriptional regulator [Cupriavidus lacunae]|uniref:LysR family transcriptional regulator n=1 Tax=Cupriavidus lacunae TaxID=2666307 RepID=A0A370P226_9BURK|nr:LysR family transcriptional regulator [Cupriavidus lacunae]RDK11921.1 LysR family transcriptional regulator [Cupriavidus lacunae]